MASITEGLRHTVEWHSSPLDWCENNYETTNLVVEFWNTLSSLCMCIVALSGFFYYSTFSHEPNLWMIWFLMTIVGIGSAFFHATLSIAGQVLDELPISFLVIYSMIILRPLNKWNLRLRAVLFSPLFLISTLILSAMACLAFPIISHIVTLSCVPFGAYIYLSEYCDCRKSGLAQRMVHFAILFLVCGIVAWLVDRLACTWLQGFFVERIGFYPQFHAFWHLMVSCCFWTLVTGGMVIRLVGDGRKVLVKFDKLFGVPYASMV